MPSWAIDWQTWVALLIGATAVARAGIPVWRRWQARRTGTSAMNAGSCTPDGAPASTPAAGCGTGCSQCGQASTAAPRDHRIHIVRG
jgi:hypothetical protein